MGATSPPGPILIVDDDKKTVSLVVTYLEREGFRTLSAHDGGQVLELVRRHAPAFVILDLMLPNGDGREICRQLRQASDIPILILTALEEEVDCVVGFSLGADDYVVKGFEGKIDEVAVYDRALSVAESAGHFSASGPPPGGGGKTAP